ncbi:MAG: hypothetical protein LUF87_01460 [Alistipes sp.]|nr:hypothetical protein [Alistipes sp.]
MDIDKIEPKEDSLELEADRIQEEIRRNEPNYHDDPDSDVLVDERPGVPNGMFGDHEDDFDIG